MSKSIRTILIPVDFTVNTDIAVSKAASILPLEGSIIHLLHIRPIAPLSFLWQFNGSHGGRHGNRASADEMAVMKLQQLEKDLKMQRPDARIYSNIVFGKNVASVIAKKSVDLAADLIVLGKRSSRRLFPWLDAVRPSEIVRMSGIPVLTIKPGAYLNSIKRVIIPVGNNFPASKLALFNSIHSNAPFQTTLIIFPQDEAHQQISKQTLINTFKMLKHHSSNPVKYEMLPGKNKARALLQFSHQQDADLLIVQAPEETRISQWLGTHICDILPSSSKTAVLTI